MLGLSNISKSYNNCELFSGVSFTIGMSDRIMVMCEGRVTGMLNRADATQDKIMAYASGHYN